MEKKKKRKKARKPKVVLKKKQVIILTAAIIAVCACMLIVSILTIPAEKEVQSAKEENISVANKTESKNSEAKEKVATTNSGKTDSSKTKSAETKPTGASSGGKTSGGASSTQESKKTSEATNKSSSNNSSSKTQASSAQKTESVNQKQEQQKPEVTPPATTAAEGPFDSVQAAANNATLVLVLDDGGQNLSHLQHFLELPFAFDVAVLPKLQYSAEAAERTRARGKEVMLHQPMQAQNLSVNPGPGAITPEMHTYDIENLVLENLQEVGPVAGINNHEGSLITRSAAKIGAVLDICKANGMFFLDSRTTAETQAPQAAMERGIHIWERDVFLDNTQNRSDIITQLLQAVKIANRDGYAIMIGHVWSSENLANILLEMYQALEPKGYKFSTVGGLYENFGN